MNYARAWKCAKCPESNGRDGCPAWWEYQGANGNTVKGCSMAQEIGLNLVRALCHDTACSAASADKAANAATSAQKSAEFATAMLIGLANGDIVPPPRQLEAHNNEEDRLSIGQIRRQ